MNAPKICCSKQCLSGTVSAKQMPLGNFFPLVTLIPFVNVCQNIKNIFIRQQCKCKFQIHFSVVDCGVYLVHKSYLSYRKFGAGEFPVVLSRRCIVHPVCGLVCSMSFAQSLSHANNILGLTGFNYFSVFMNRLKLYHKKTTGSQLGPLALNREKT